MNTTTDNGQKDKILDVIQGQDFIKTVINQMPIRIFIKDTMGRFLVANKAIADFLGRSSPDDVIGKTDFDFYPKAAAEEYFADEQKIIATGTPIREKEEPKNDPTGKKRACYITKMPIKNRKGEIIGIFGFAADVTERRLAETSLQQERNFLRTLIDTIPDYIYMKDTSSRFIMANTTLAQHMGVKTPDELIGKTDFDFYAKDIATSFFADEQELVRTGKPLIQKDEISSTLAENTSRVLTTKVPMKDSRGNIIAIVGAGHDITPETRMERTLVETNTKLGATLDELKHTQYQLIENERMNALGQMASGITHDFNNALTPILGYSDLLLNGPGLLDDKTTTCSMLKDICTAATDAAHTVRRLSEFYAPARKTARKPVNLSTLIDSTLALAKPLLKELSEIKNIDIHVTTKLDEVQNVFGNEPQLREMFTNLILNAIEAMPKGGKLIIRARKENQLVLVDITDTGIGMTEDARKRCFEPFFTTKHKRGGGLGLAMVHGIVRQHEGKIDIHSVDGKGTTFTVRIPEATGHVIEETVKIPRPLEVRKMNVLLIDDEEVVRKAIAACLKSDNHTVHTATDGNQGIELFRREQFDIVITDRAMPGMSGDHVASEIKKINPNIPVIMLTGFGHIMKDLQQHPAGVDLIVSKPVTRESLRDSLVKAISHKKH